MDVKPEDKRNYVNIFYDCVIKIWRTTAVLATLPHALQESGLLLSTWQCLRQVKEEIVVEYFRYSNEQVGIDRWLREDVINVGPPTIDFASQPCWRPFLSPHLIFDSFADMDHSVMCPELWGLSQWLRVAGVMIKRKREPCRRPSCNPRPSNLPQSPERATSTPRFYMQIPLDSRGWLP